MMSNNYTTAHDSMNLSHEQAVAMLLENLKEAEENAEKEGWITADELEKELKIAE